MATRPDAHSSTAERWRRRDCWQQRRQRPARNRIPITNSEHAGHDSTADYPRDRPSTGGPVGSPTDRGMLVPGLGTAGKPPVPVIVPDLSEKVPWKLVDGVKEFHLYCRHTRREVLPDLYIDVWGFNDLMPGPTIEVDARGSRADLGPQ